jgi:hypothetical protein
VTNIKLSKLTAARRQLNTGIVLWFSEADPVSIHTLVAAAHEIIHAIFKRRGQEDLLFDNLRVKDEHRNAWIASIRRNANFFKHADRDPDGVLDFDPSVNDMHMLYCIIGLKRMGEDTTFEERVFMYRFFLEYPDHFMEDRYTSILGARVVAADRAFSRSRFWVEIRKRP